MLIEAKENYLGFGLRPGHASVSTWATTTGGEYTALGVRGASAGLRADLVIIDDPVKSQADAESFRLRSHVWEWYKADITPRIKPGGKVVLIMTRWHPDDLGGQLLRHAPADWQVLRLPALAEENDPLGRQVGEPLWPEWESLPALIRKRSMVGERIWSALYQQRPQTTAASLFAVDRITVLESAPPAGGSLTIRAWDLAATKATGDNDPDWTVGIKLRRADNGFFVVMDVVRIRGSPSEIERIIDRTAKIDGHDVIISLPEDPGQAGKSQVMYLARQLAGFRVHTSREVGSKVSRATPLASQIETGNLAIVRGPWNADFLEELRLFPLGQKDDQVDAVTRAFNGLIERGSGTQVTNLAFLER